jgi:hypothetical protein
VVEGGKQSGAPYEPRTAAARSRASRADNAPYGFERAVTFAIDDDPAAIAFAERARRWNTFTSGSAIGRGRECAFRDSVFGDS